MSKPFQTVEGKDSWLLPSMLTAECRWEEKGLTPADMVKFVVEEVLEARPDWTEDSKWVQEAKQNAEAFYGALQPGDKLMQFDNIGPLCGRAGEVILRGRVAVALRVTRMS